MNLRIITEIYNKQSSKPIKYSIVFFCILTILIFSLNGCSDQPSAPPVQAPKKKGAVSTAAQPATPQTETVVAEEVPEQEGYIYQQKDRRDPFVPLIVPKKKAVKREGTRPGTLISYDISEFTLAAIAKKGGQYFALLTTPDNRSFTVNKGTAIGLHRGKVQDITKGRLVIIEYASDFRGESKPRQIILEFHKGEVE